MPQTIVEEFVTSDRQIPYGLMQDYKHRLAWDSYAQSVKFDHGLFTSNTAFAGPATWVNPFRMIVEHIDLCAPSLMRTCMVKGPFFLSAMHCDWQFLPHTSGTLIRATIHFKSRWPWLTKILDPAIKWTLVRDARRIIEDLKKGAENATLVNRLTLTAW